MPSVSIELSLIALYEKIALSIRTSQIADAGKDSILTQDVHTPVFKQLQSIEFL